MWIRWRFLAHEGLCKKIIVHGHTPTAEVEFQPIASTSTPAHFPHRPLSALVIDGAERRVLTVSEKGQRASVTTPWHGGAVAGRLIGSIDRDPPGGDRGAA